jgi:hypothetical protein
MIAPIERGLGGQRTNGSDQSILEMRPAARARSAARRARAAAKNGVSTPEEMKGERTAANEIHAGAELASLG